MSASEEIPPIRPGSDVSSAVGLVGLAGLFAWVGFARGFPAIADLFELAVPRDTLGGPNSALVGLLAAALPMAAWSVLVDKVHLRPSTGLDWGLVRSRRPDRGVTWTKLLGLWATWIIIAGLYCLCRWYWSGNYLFAMHVLAYAAMPLVFLSIPYVFWLDRAMVEPRDHAWHFGALLLMRRGWDTAEIARHWRSWIIKAFFTAFMISIVPFAFRTIVSADLAEVFARPERVALTAIEAMFMVDVMIGTVGYIVTMRPLDAHIRSGNPLLAGWVAALICYPPLVWGILGGGKAINYEEHTAGWLHWLEGNDLLIAGWGALLVFLTAMYAWATFAFGLRFSNLTYRGVLTNGPYRFTRHPAYLSKNLFWWCATLPFLVTGGSWIDAIRNCFFLALVNAIYFWRARTEEAHLLAEDAKYREYHAYMARHGAITAPLSRLFERLRPRPAVVPAPAE